MLVSFRFLARIRDFYILAGFFWPSYPSGTPDGLVCLQAMEFPGLFTVVACGYHRGPLGLPGYLPEEFPCMPDIPYAHAG